MTTAITFSAKMTLVLARTLHIVLVAVLVLESNGLQ